MEMLMKNLSRKSLLGVVALTVSLAAPFAFAQSTDAAAAQPAAAPTAAAATPAAPAATQKKSWNDVDSDKDGKLSKTEASSVPALSQVFDQADGDKDGALTADEYKAYVAKTGPGASTKK